MLKKQTKKPAPTSPVSLPTPPLPAPLSPPSDPVVPLAQPSSVIAATEEASLVPAGKSRTPAAAYAFFLPQAMALPSFQVNGRALDSELAFGNVQSAVASIEPCAARIKKELPAISLENLLSLPELAKAVLHAIDEANLALRPPKRENLQELLTPLFAAREPMLLCAEALALLGYLPKDRVAAIRAGSGPLDAAQDGMALYDLYTEHKAAISGKHPFVEKDLLNIRTLGEDLMDLVTPTGARPAVRAKQAKALEIRDRMTALLVERYADLRRVAMYLFGDAASEKVPALQTRQRPSRKPTEPPPSDPTP